MTLGGARRSLQRFQKSRMVELAGDPQTVGEVQRPEEQNIHTIGFSDSIQIIQALFRLDLYDAKQRGIGFGHISSKALPKLASAVHGGHAADALRRIP